MTLSRKIFLLNVGLLIGVTLLGGAALTGLWRLSAQVEVAIDEYAELRLLSTAELGALEAQGRLLAAEPDLPRAQEDLNRGAAALDEYLALQADAREGSDDHERQELQNASAAAQAMRRVVSRLQAGAPVPQADRAALAAEVREAIRPLRELAREADGLVARTGRRASNKLRDTILAVAAIFLVIAACTIVIGRMQHRSIMTPLRVLTDGVRSVASGRFSQRLKPAGDREFACLTGEFNRMAGELDELYRGLEEKVAAKSRELVRSERLASVGFLAAGVAHEVNNPLHIISGYAELSLRRLKQYAAAAKEAGLCHEAASDGSMCAALNDAQQTLQIIRDESFRCKQITEKLLSLSDPGTDREKSVVSLVHIAREVGEVVRAHDACRDRKLELRFDASEPLLTRASAPEIKQVLLNLLINGLEAVGAGDGCVTVEGSRSHEWVELRVSDDGCGMSQEVLRNVFEPFYSDKRGKDGRTSRRGLGLGLSISHAIVERHGGQLVAESPGPAGKGSRFIVRLPAEDAAGIRPAENGAIAENAAIVEKELV